MSKKYDIDNGRARARGRVAALSRSRSADDPDLLAARAELKTATETARINGYIDGLVASAPPLSDEQRAKLAGLLRPTVKVEAA